mgnify:FL=1
MYNVVIITYYKRFQEWFKPLLLEIKKQRPNCEVIVAVNGEISSFREDFRKEILNFCAEFEKVYPILYPRFRGFSRLCNLSIQFSPEENVLILSDDIELEEEFFKHYEDILNYTSVNPKEGQSFSINDSFSAFSINKKDAIDINWFDERFLGMGYEDGDFIERYKYVKKVRRFPVLVTSSCRNTVDKNLPQLHNSKLEKFIESEERLVNQRLDESGRYSLFNKEVKENKDFIQIQYPYEKYYLDNKDKL